MEMNKYEHFTKEQLITNISAKAARIRPDSQVNDSLRIEALMNKRVLEIALAALTAPDDVPPRVEDGICHMSDGGVNAQGIWELCKAAALGGAQ